MRITAHRFKAGSSGYCEHLEDGQYCGAAVQFHLSDDIVDDRRVPFEGEAEVPAEGMFADCRRGDHGKCIYDGVPITCACSCHVAARAVPASISEQAQRAAMRIVEWIDRATPHIENHSISRDGLVVGEIAAIIEAELPQRPRHCKDCGFYFGEAVCGNCGGEMTK